MTSPVDRNERQSLLDSSPQTWATNTDDTGSSFQNARAHVRRFLNAKFGHYAILLLVSLDVGCIFADFLISLYVCEHYCGQKKSAARDLLAAQDALGIVSLVFSCLFMAELIASVWAFGFMYVYLTSKELKHRSSGIHRISGISSHGFIALMQLSS